MEITWISIFKWRNFSILILLLFSTNGIPAIPQHANPHPCTSPLQTRWTWETWAPCTLSSVSRLPGSFPGVVVIKPSDETTYAPHRVFWARPSAARAVVLSIIQANTKPLGISKRWKSKLWKVDKAGPDKSWSRVYFLRKTWMWDEYLQEKWIGNSRKSWIWD